MPSDDSFKNELPPTLGRPALNPKQTAEYLNISVATLASDRCRPSLRIPYIKLGRLIRYDPDILDEIKRSRAVTYGDPNGSVKAGLPDEAA